MRYVCTGCGNEIPDGQDFCYVCGSWKKNALSINDEGDTLYANTCTHCNKAIPAGSDYCPHCGEKLEDTNTVPITFRRVRPFTNKDLMAIALAIVPGFFNIFGLGQIVQRRWSRAFVFMAATLLLLYVGPSFLTTANHYTILVILQVSVFIFSISDVLRGINQRGM